MTEHAINCYLERLDAQRRATFEALVGLREEQIWQRPAPGEWSIGEILSHTVRFFDSFMPGLGLIWRLLGWYGRLGRNRAYEVEIEDVYRRPHFPMWTGIFWKPRHTPEKPVPLAQIKAEIESIHQGIHAFYAGKEPDVLGNVHAYDPAIGVVNLITALKVGVDHDQLHYEDVVAQAAILRVEA